MFIIDVTHPVIFCLCLLLLCVFIFACGVIGTLIGIAIAKGVLRAIDREAVPVTNVNARLNTGISGKPSI